MLLLLPMLSALVPLLFAPQVEFSQPAPIEQRAKLCQVKFVATLASGKSSEDLGISVSRSDSAVEVCDGFARVCAILWATFHQDQSRLTLFDYEGDPIIGLKVVVVPTTPNDPGILPQVTVRWVPRVPPRIARVELQPAPRGAAPLARVASGAFAAAVTTVAAPEIDFGTIPKADKWPRVYYIRFHTRLASGLFEEDYPGHDWVCDVPSAAIRTGASGQRMCSGRTTSTGPTSGSTWRSQEPPGGCWTTDAGRGPGREDRPRGRTDGRDQRPAARPPVDLAPRVPQTPQGELTPGELPTA